MRTNPLALCSLGHLAMNGLGRRLRSVGLLAFLAAGPVWATTYYVGGSQPAGTAQGVTWFDTSSGDAWASLQAAFFAAQAGDEVRICGDVSRTPGETTTRDLKLSNSGTAAARIVVSGGWDPDFSAAPAPTARSVLNGNNNGTAANTNRTLTLSGHYVTLRNVTLTGGDDTYWHQQAANYVTGDYCVFSRVTVTSNNTDAVNFSRTRGGLRWDGDRGIIEYTQIVGNRGSTSGGLSLENAYSTVVANSEIARNWVTDVGAAGLRIGRAAAGTTVLFGTLVALNEHYGTTPGDAYGDTCVGGVGFAGPNDQTAPGACFVNSTVADNGRCLGLGLAEGGFTAGQYFLNTIQANNNNKKGIDNYIYSGANRDVAPNNWNWDTGTTDTGARGWIGYLHSGIHNDLSLGFGHARNQANWGPASTNTEPLSNLLADPRPATAPRFRDAATTNGTPTKIYVADNARYLAGDVVEINRDRVARTVTGLGADAGGPYITIDTPLAANSARYTGAANTTFIENWGPGRTSADLAARDYSLTADSPCIDSGAVVDAGEFLYVDVNQNGVYNWGLDIIVKLKGYTPVSPNTPNPTCYDLVYTTDLAGNDRLAGGSIDMGAYEKGASGPLLEVPGADLGGVTNDFSIGRTELTVAEYVVFLNEANSNGTVVAGANGEIALAGTGERLCLTTGAQPQAYVALDAGAPAGQRFSAVTDRADHPMIQVSWFGAAAYCNWLSLRDGKTAVYVPANNWQAAPAATGYRLPTEAEWLKAAAWDKATGVFRKFGTSSDALAPADANFLNSGDAAENEAVRTTRAGGYLPSSPYNLKDASGNVWEWCHDLYDPSAGNPAADAHALRGGAWGNLAGDVSTAARIDNPPAAVRNSVGFRILRPR